MPPPGSIPKWIGGKNLILVSTRKRLILGIAIAAILGVSAAFSVIYYLPSQPLSPQAQDPLPPLWLRTIPGNVSFSGVIGGNMYYTFSLQNGVNCDSCAMSSAIWQVFAIYLSNGSIAWSSKPIYLSSEGNVGPVLSYNSGILYFIGAGYSYNYSNSVSVNAIEAAIFVQPFDALNGSNLSLAYYPVPIQFTISGQIVPQGSKVFYSYAGTLGSILLDSSSGTSQSGWTRNVSATGALYVSQNYVVIGTGGNEPYTSGDLFSFNLTSGNEVWNVSNVNCDVGNMKTLNDTLYCLGYQGQTWYLRGYDLANGNLGVDSLICSSSSAVEPGGIWVISQNRIFVADSCSNLSPVFTAKGEPAWNITAGYLGTTQSSTTSTLARPLSVDSGGLALFEDSPVTLHSSSTTDVYSLRIVLVNSTDGSIVWQTTYEYSSNPNVHVYMPPSAFVGGLNFDQIISSNDYVIYWWNGQIGASVV